jgi:hypothetical protein
MNQRAKSLAPYVAQLAYDEEVRDAAKRAAGATSAAWGRARSRRSHSAARDKKLRRQLSEAAGAAFELWAALGGPPPQPKRRWPRNAAITALAGGGLLLAVNGQARAALLGLIGKADASTPEAT